jgi:oligopeptide/dipeptide ABC transporter ATP-binding protein
VSRAALSEQEAADRTESVLVRARGLKVEYPVRGGGRKHRGRTVSAVAGVDLEIGEGETVGLVGESGCGKTTLGRALIGRVPLTGGTIEFDGKDITNASRKQWRELNRDIQFVFQDPYASLNPRRTVGQTIAEPLQTHGIASGKELQARVTELLDMVRLPQSAAARYPYAFSGGQRQRIVIARALALQPRFIVADEPVSALDVSIQAQVIGLLEDLQRDLGLSSLFIAHNLAAVRHIADRVAVMYLGRVVELATSASLYSAPRHPYTQALLSAAPIPDPSVQRPGRIILAGDPPSPVDPPAGCRFHTRCPLAVDRCRTEVPPLATIAEGHQVACWVAHAQATIPVPAVPPKTVHGVPA